MPTPLRLLSLEDSESDLQLILLELQEAGFEPLWERVQTERDYLARLDADLDIILADYSLPQFDAMKALRLRNECGLDIPFIIVSGSIGEDTAVVAMQQGAADYVLKDRLGRLGHAVSRALEQKRSTDAHRRAEQALKESESRLRIVTDNSRVGLVMVNQERRYIFANATYSEVLGLPISDIVGRRVPELIPDIYEEQIRPHLDRAFAGERVAYELQKPVQNGARFFAVTYEPTKVGDTVTHVVVVIVDITERKQSEEALRESEERFRNAFDYTNVGMVLTDLENRFTRSNAAFAQMFGYSQSQILQLSMADITHPDDVAESNQRRKSLLSGERQFFEMQKRYVHKNGNVLWGLTNVSLVRDAEGQPLLYVGQVQDITARKELEDQFRQAQQRLQHVLASSPAVLYTLAIEGEDLRLTWISENLREMMGYRLEDVFQESWWHDRVHPEDLPGVLAQFQNELFPHAHSDQEYRFRHFDGKYRWVRSEMKLQRDADGKPVEVIGSWSDISERKQLEEQYRQAQKMEAIGVLAGGVAHDFNNLLTVIMGYSDIYIGTLKPEDPLRVPLVEIRKAGERATGLTRQLLAFSRKQVLMPVVLDLNAILCEMEKMLRRLIGEDIGITILLGPDVWKVKADPGQIEQVVMNIVVNARDAMPMGGKVLLETKNVVLDGDYVHTHAQTHSGEYVLLAISDTGCGIDAATKARIFEPFFTTKGPTKGTGLGLATVFGIVKQSGGHIEVYSEVGQGTAFKIYLPRDRSRAPVASGVRTLQPLRGGTETILLVEDEEGVRTLAKVVLQRHGYNVIEARHGGEALLICENYGKPIHLLVTDVVMPHLSGRQLAERLTNIEPMLKVLYMSGYTDDAIVHHGVLESGLPFMQKPFAPEAFARKVREVLDQ